MVLLSCSLDFAALSNEQRARDNKDLFLDAFCTKVLPGGEYSGASKVNMTAASPRRPGDFTLFCAAFAFNFYSPGTDYGLERTFGIEKTVMIENIFTFSFIEIPDNKCTGMMFSLFICLFILTKSFKTIAVSKFAILIPPCRVCEESDPPII